MIMYEWRGIPANVDTYVQVVFTYHMITTYSYFFKGKNFTSEFDCGKF